MKRLQVGDECYVRLRGSVDIIKCAYIGHRESKVGTMWEHVANKIDISGAVSIAIGKGSPNKLVYPFPCIKELAR